MAAAAARGSSNKNRAGTRSFYGSHRAKYRHNSLVHEITDSSIQDITTDVLSRRAAVQEHRARRIPIYRLAHFDHAHDLRKSTRNRQVAQIALFPREVLIVTRPLRTQSNILNFYCWRGVSSDFDDNRAPFEIRLADLESFLTQNVCRR